MTFLSKKAILDVTCGSRTIWFNKNHPLAIYMDKRVEHCTGIWGGNQSMRSCDVDPDVVADFTNIPYEDNSFYLVVMDPPHLKSVGENAWLRKKYGRLDENWPMMIHDGFKECMRVLKSGGVLILKWNEIQIPTRKIIDAIGEEPLFGHRSGKKMQTHWLCYMKTDGLI